MRQHLRHLASVRDWVSGVSLIVLRARNLHRVNLHARTSSCTMASSTSHTKLSLCSFLQSSSAKTLRNLRGEHLEFRQSHNMDAEKRAQRTGLRHLLPVRPVKRGFCLKWWTAVGA